MRKSAIDQLFRALATLMRRRSELTAVVHPDVSLTSYTLLRGIEAVPGIRATDLALQFGLDRSTVSRQLTDLEAAGLVSRQGELPGHQGQGPGRPGQALALTSEGQRRLEVESEKAIQLFNERLAGWKSRDLAAFAEMVERFLDDVLRGSNAEQSEVNRPGIVGGSILREEDGDDGTTEVASG